MKVELDMTKEVVSTSAKAPAYNVFKVGGQKTLVIDSAHKTAVSEIFSKLKAAKSATVSAHKLQAKIDKSSKASKTNAKTDSPEKKKKDIKQRKELAAEVKKLHKAAAASMKAAHAAQKKAGLSGLGLALSTVILSSPVKLAKVSKLNVFKVKGIAGAVAPKYMKDANGYTNHSAKVKTAAKPKQVLNKDRTGYVAKGSKTAGTKKTTAKKITVNGKPFDSLDAYEAHTFEDGKKPKMPKKTVRGEIKATKKPSAAAKAPVEKKRAKAPAKAPVEKPTVTIRAKKNLAIEKKAVKKNKAK